MLMQINIVIGTINNHISGGEIMIAASNNAQSISTNAKAISFNLSLLFV